MQARLAARRSGKQGSTDSAAGKQGVRSNSSASKCGRGNAGGAGVLTTTFMVLSRGVRAMRAARCTTSRVASMRVAPMASSISTLSRPAGSREHRGCTLIDDGL